MFISRNHNEAAAKKFRKAPQVHLISASLTIKSQVPKLKDGGKELDGSKGYSKAEGQQAPKTDKQG